MNWNQLWMYVAAKQAEFVEDVKIPPQETVIEELDGGDITVGGTERRWRK